MVQTVAEDVQTWRNRTVIDSRGDRIGKVEDVFYDRETARAHWALVNTGMIGTRRNFVPIQRARTLGHEAVQIPYTEEQVSSAPAVEPGEMLADSQQIDLYRYYGIDPSTKAPGALTRLSGIAE